ncbi:hypothetical protein CMV_009036 [Castanea mollissima]|uniref:Uncharacterized protein n=1 Tax=Castanea mollissima TaxID=60419 RepID=A0A8J4RIM9_9ROSI|nr:hypothetical protein CMV_009036 [Castanea mollissima]
MLKTYVTLHLKFQALRISKWHVVSMESYSTITIPMSHAAKFVSMFALTIQKLPMQLLRPKYSLLAATK